MTIAEAPLYVRAHDLAVWLDRGTAAWPSPVGDLALAVRAAARRLACESALSLTFRDRRIAHLDEADEAIVRLREMLRIAVDLEIMDRKRLRHPAAELADIGRIIGGWRKRLKRRPEADVPP